MIHLHRLILSALQLGAPGYSTRLPAARRHRLFDLTLEDGKPKGGEMEAVAFVEPRPGGWRSDIRAVRVVRLPFRNVVELSPDLGGGYALGDDFV